jgi:hypothetical protein
MRHIPAHGIGGALKPGRIIHGLLSGQYPHKGSRKIIKTVCIVYMVIKRFRVKLRQHIYIFEARMQAIAYRDIYKTVFPADGNGRFRAIHGKRKKSFTLAAAENQRYGLMNVRHTNVDYITKPSKNKLRRI